MRSMQRSQRIESNPPGGCPCDSWTSVTSPLDRDPKPCYIIFIPKGTTPMTINFKSLFITTCVGLTLILGSFAFTSDYGTEIGRGEQTESPYYGPAF